MKADETAVEEILRRAALICMSLAGSVLLCALLIYLLVEQQAGKPWTEAPATGPFFLALAALLLLFISGAARSRVLRSFVEAKEDAGEAPRPAELAQAFFRATILCFGFADGAAVLGLASAWLGKSSFYGFVICAASFYVMLARWPRRTAFEAFADGDRRADS